MGTSVLPYLYRFNGVVDTNQPVLQNIETLTSAAGTWLTYDIALGKWAVIINKPTAVSATFDDSNIIGGIQIGTTSLTDLYNAVKVTFPRDDLDDQRDFVRAEIPAGDRNANEPDNDLNIDYDILNDPVQAEYLGLLELQQNRLDQTMSFVTDYSMLGLRAGDVVEITSAQYGITNYALRITSVTEVDDDSGGIQLQIVGVKYDAAIYDPDLNRYERSNQNGLITLNGINQPGNIATTLYEKDARPRILANTTVPGNVAIETVELWSSTDNVNFELVGNLPPPGGGTYSIGDTVTFDFDRALTGNVYLKSRALNSSATGPYSNVAVIPYTPVQVTDAIGNNTTMLDGAGNSISTLLALTSLLKGLDTLMDGDTTALTRVPVITKDVITVASSTVQTKFDAMAANVSLTGYDPVNTGNRNNWIAGSFAVPSGVKSIDIDVKSPLGLMTYTAHDSVAEFTTQILCQPALAVLLLEGSNLITANTVVASTIDWNSNYNKVVVETPAAGTYWVAASIIETYDLSMNWAVRDGVTAPSPQSIPFSAATFASSPSGDMNFIVSLTV